MKRSLTARSRFDLAGAADQAGGEGEIGRLTLDKVDGEMVGDDDVVESPQVVLKILQGAQESAALLGDPVAKAVTALEPIDTTARVLWSGETPRPCTSTWPL